MNFIDGTQITRLGDKTKSLSAGQRKHAMSRIISRVSEAYGRMLLFDGLFQADGHPGNILVMKGKPDSWSWGVIAPEVPQVLRQPAEHCGFARSAVYCSSAGLGWYCYAAMLFAADRLCCAMLHDHAEPDSGKCLKHSLRRSVCNVIAHALQCDCTCAV